MEDLHIGSSAELTPADGTAPMAAKIDEIVPRGEFATWRTARAVGGHDLNTFVLRPGPVLRRAEVRVRDLDTVAIAVLLGTYEI